MAILIFESREMVAPAAIAISESPTLSSVLTEFCQVVKKNFGWVLTRLGNAYFFLGQYPEAINYYQKNLELAKETGDHSGESKGLGGF